MPSAQLYAGLQDPCCSTLEFGGVAYFMVAYAGGVETRNSEFGGVRVQAQCYSIHEQGQPTLLFDTIVASAAANHVLECVHVVHVHSDTFVVYYIDRDTSAGTSTLEAKFLDLTTLDAGVSWSAESSISIDDGGLYDVKQVIGVTGLSEYMLAWISAVGSPGTLIVRRVDSEDHTAALWSTSLAPAALVEKVCAVHGDGRTADNNGGVVVCYQDADNDLIAHVLDYNDGTDVGAITAFSSTSAQWCAVGMADTNLPSAPAAPRVAIIAECFETLAPVVAGPDDFARVIHAREIRATSSPTSLSAGQTTYNLAMMSKPYSYVDAEGSRHVYCGLAYSTVWFDDPYREQNAFICDMGYQHWSAGADTAHARPVATFAGQNIDCRNHGYSPEIDARFNAAGIGKRMNHLSNFAHGPSWLCDLRKARVVAWPAWGGLGTVERGDLPNGGGTRSEPVTAAVRAIWHVLEDPWTANRDPLDYSQPGVNVHYDGSRGLHHNASVQSELFIAGGTPHSYDGRQIVEVGFPWSPEIVLAVDGGGVSTIVNGSYRYVALYEWRDAKGQLHRSGLSNVVTHLNAGNDDVNLTIRTMTISNRDAAWIYAGASPIQIVLYRTTIANPGRFQRLHATSLNGFGIAETPTSTPGAWAIVVNDAVPDFNLSGAPILTIIDGGGDTAQSELPPLPPPAAHLVCNWQNRCFLACSEEREFAFSKENLTTAAEGRIAPEFHPFLRVNLDVVKGDVTGFMPLNDTLVFFTRDGVYALSGTGPDALGLNMQYQITVVAEETGCIEPRSIVSTPMGLLFQSYKGMYLLDDAMKLDHISAGAPIVDELAASGNVRSGDNLEDRNTVALVANGAVTNSPLVLKWEYYQRQWSTSVIPAQNSTAWLASTAGGCTWRGNERDLSHVILSQGNLSIERGRDDDEPYRDELAAGTGVPVRVDIETGWMHFAGIAGHLRTWEIGITLGTHNTASSLFAELDVDRTGEYDTSAPEDHRFGGAGTYHAALASYLPIKPELQRMTASRLRLYESTAVDSSIVGIYTTPLAITGFSATIGVQRRGLRRINNATRGVIQ